MVRRLNVYVGKERIHCLSVVRLVAMNQMQLSRWSGATEIQNNSSLLVIRHTRRVILDFQWGSEGLSRFELKFGRLVFCNRNRSYRRMGRKKHNLCSKCEFRHAAPTGKACTARVGLKASEKIVEDDKSLQGEQGPNIVELDALDDAPCRQKDVSVVGRVEKIEQDMGAMNGKLDVIIASMQKTALPESDGDEIIEEWSKDVAEAWSEVKPRGRA